MERKIQILGVNPEHPRPGSGPSTIVAHVELAYLKGANVVAVTLSEPEALRLAEQLVSAVRTVQRANGAK